MIGWKAKLLFSDAQFALPNNINQIQFNDDGIVSVPTFGVRFDRITGNYANVLQQAREIIGEDSNALYSIPAQRSRNTNDNYIKFNEFFPSLFLSFTKSYEKFLSSSGSVVYSIALYIPGLKRVIYRSGGAPQVWAVSDSGVLSKVGERGTILDAITDSGSMEYRAQNIYKYNGPDSLQDVSNWLDLSIIVSKTGNCTASNLGPLNTELANWIKAIFGEASEPDYDKPVNPYEPGGPSGPGGGDGSFDNDSDQIIDSSLPTISSANTGFTRIYNPSLSQVQALARYLWTDENVIQTIWNHIKQYFEDPMQAIIGFNLVPVPVPSGGTQSFALMYIDTGVEMTVAASQFVDVDCGTFELKEYYGSALDYAPNTKVSCFLPFIGTVSLNTDEVMGRTLQVKYRVDICSGACVAKIAVDGNFIYQYSGHCAINIPISSADFSSYVSSAISVAQLAAGAMASGAGGVMASTAVDATQQTNQVVTTTQITNTARNPATGRQITTGTMTRVETRESPNGQSSTQGSFSGITPQNISNTVGQIMSSKPNINHSGSFSGNSGYLGVRRPFLIIERPNMCMPSNFQVLNGFPSMITLELSTCKGFTRVQQVQLSGFYATNPEQAEILQLLKSGVIL